MQPANDKSFVRIELTPEQQKQVKATTGRDSVAIELSAQELEERIAPRLDAGWGTNHNETMLGDD